MELNAEVQVDFLGFRVDENSYAIPNINYLGTRYGGRCITDIKSSRTTIKRFAKELYMLSWCARAMQC